MLLSSEIAGDELDFGGENSVHLSDDTVGRGESIAASGKDATTGGGAGGPIERAVEARGDVGITTAGLLRRALWAPSAALPPLATFLSPLQLSLIHI